MKISDHDLEVPMKQDVHAIPQSCWSRKLEDPLPKNTVHAFSRPPILEALQLLPVAYRVGSYIAGERSAGREPIFDLNGITLSPPLPVSYAFCYSIIQIYTRILTSGSLRWLSDGRSWGRLHWKRISRRMPPMVNPSRALHSSGPWRKSVFG